jgi:solute carrier family 26 (sodium-independent sulfate anion transporter), member 11
VQALIDTRKEVERWTNSPVEFHFASILSPWIRRALVAGGFGFDHRIQSTRPHDVAAIVSYDDSQPHSPILKDVEAGDSVQEVSLHDPAYGGVQRGEAPAVQIDTPYFHLDLAEAVAAAEASLLKLSPSRSSHSVGK